MKKELICMAFMVTCFFSFGQAWQQGDVNIDAYYGYVGPGIILNSVNQLTGLNRAGVNYDSKTSVLGPVGIRAQYMLTKKFAVGLDVNYESKKASWNEDDYDYEIGAFQNYKATYSITKMKVMVRTSWEFLSLDRFTMNFANSIGFKSGKRKLDAGDDGNFGATESMSPFALRSAVGARFFITDNINIHADGGFFGGGWLTAGIGYKL